ncbi:MAG: ABC transporter permease protein [uncultured bacterium]|nr:MAG: ABC transporter permease protein [uncultured bacterium]
MKNTYYAIISKDVKEILLNWQILLPMVIMPLMMGVFMPFMMILGLEKGKHSLHGLEPLLKMLPTDIAFMTDVSRAFYVLIDFMCPPLFLMIPLMAGSIIGASCLIVEKERRTLETLLYTPVTLPELFVAKLFATFIPSFIVTLISFAGFCIVVNIFGQNYLNGAVFPNLKWLILIFWVSPAIILFGLSAMVIISAYASTFQSAQQLSGFIIVPFILLLTAQTSGHLIMNTGHYLLFSPVLLLVDYLIISFAAKRLTYERLLE